MQQVCFKMQIALLYLFVLIATSISTKIDCQNYPTNNWESYRVVKIKPFSIVVSTIRSFENASFILTRQTDYKCSNNDTVAFKTKWDLSLLPQLQAIANCSYRFRLQNLEPNTSEWNSTVANVTAEYQNSSQICNDSGVVWSSWSFFAKIPYLFENCNKLYWSNWLETSNCKSSSHKNYARWCTDCDGFVVDKHFCAGNTTKSVFCRPSWGEWSETRCCSITGIALRGERIRTRKCLYVNGSEAFHVKQCSDQSPIMTEQCYKNVNTSLCNCQEEMLSLFPSTGNMSGLYFGIGFIIPVVLVLCIVLVLVKYRRCIAKKLFFHIEANRISSPLDLAVTTPVAATETSACERVKPLTSNTFEWQDEINSRSYEVEQAEGEYSCIEEISPPQKVAVTSIQTTKIVNEECKPSYCIMQESCGVANTQKTEKSDEDCEPLYTSIQKFCKEATLEKGEKTI